MFEKLEKDKVPGIWGYKAAKVLGSQELHLPRPFLSCLECSDLYLCALYAHEVVRSHPWNDFGRRRAIETTYNTEDKSCSASI